MHVSSVETQTRCELGIAGWVLPFTSNKTDNCYFVVVGPGMNEKLPWIHRKTVNTRFCLQNKAPIIKIKKNL